MSLPQTHPRVILDLTPSLHRLGGIGRYAEELSRALACPGPGQSPVDLRLFAVDPVGRSLALPAPGIPTQVRRQALRSWRLTVGLAHVAGRSLDRAVGATPGDLFHATDHILPPLSAAVRSVFTLHDLSVLAVPETHSFLNRTYGRWMMGRFLARADLILADSESTRREALSRFPLAADKVRTVHLGVAPRFHPRSPEEIERVRLRLGLPARYALSVGTLEPRKNLRTALAAFTTAAVPGLALGLVGPRGWHLEQAIGADLASGRGRPDVIVTGPVDDADLPALYSGASVFLFPSLHEGFGFPALEALACGAPVLASNTTSLPEIVGDAGILLPPTDVAAWAAALRAVATDRERALELAARGPRQAAAFTWEKTARETTAAYEELHARRA